MILAIMIKYILQSPAQKNLHALFVVLVLAVLPACSVNPATGQSSFTAFMSPADEKRIGAEEHPKIIEQFGGAYEEGKMAPYVEHIGERLSLVSELAGEKFTFTVLNDDTINAFALPGGYVYVTRGLIALAENEAELAGVVAHEIGHVTARHTAERYSTAMATNIGLTILGIVGAVYGAPGSATDLISRGADSILKGYSRDQELEADMLGVRYIARAGYDPEAMSSFFNKMKGHDELQSDISGKPSNEESFNHASTHPRTSKRIHQAIELAKETNVENPVFGTDLFLNAVDGIIFGDDPEQGIRRGRDFMHPGLKFQFRVPEGFVLKNTPDRVIAEHPNGSAIIFDMENPKKAQKIDDIRSYLVNTWGKTLSLRNVEELDINDMNAWTGSMRRNTRSGPRDIRLIVIRGDASQIFRLAFLTPIDEFDKMAKGLKRMTYSFKRLSQAEADAIKPWRVKVITADNTTTPENLAKKMDKTDHAQQWFELLNMTALQDGIEAGERLKIIGE